MSDFDDFDFDFDFEDRPKSVTHDYPPVIDRPRHAGALNLKDIKTGVRIVEHNFFLGATTFIVKSMPFFDDGEIWVMAQNEEHGSVDSESLADAGVVPYGNGRWNANNYTTLARTKLQVKRAYLKSGEYDDAKVFFGDLMVTVGELSPEGHCDYEVSVPDKVRDTVQPQVLEWSNITVHLVHD